MKTASFRCPHCNQELAVQAPEPIYVLALNDMRSSKIQYRDLICYGSKDELEAFLKREKTEVYQDGRWSKTYRRGGPLEWYNTPFEGFGQGILEADQSFRNDCLHVGELES